MTSVKPVTTWIWNCPGCLTAYVGRIPPATHSCVNPNCSNVYALDGGDAECSALVFGVRVDP